MLSLQYFYVKLNCLYTPRKITIINKNTSSILCNFFIALTLLPFSFTPSLSSRTCSYSTLIFLSPCRSPSPFRSNSPFFLLHPFFIFYTLSVVLVPIIHSSSSLVFSRPVLQLVFLYSFLSALGSNILAFSFPSLLFSMILFRLKFTIPTVVGLILILGCILISYHSFP